MILSIGPIFIHFASYFGYCCKGTR